MSEQADDLFVTDDPEGFWNAEVYHCDDGAERLDSMDPHDAVEAELDSRYDQDNPTAALTGTLTVYAFKRGAISPRNLDADRLLEDVLERLDEEYGDPDEASEPTDAMQAAAVTFLATIRAEYRVWNCERVAEATVDVAAWAKSERPDWLEAASPLPAPPSSEEAR